MSAQIRPRRRFLMPILPRSGARIRSATGSIVAVAVVCIAVLLAAYLNARAREAADQVSHSIAVRESAERFLGHMRDAETGQRGFLLTADPDYLAPFTLGRSAALPELDALQVLVAEDKPQAGRVAAARAEAQRKLDELDETIALTRAGRAEDAIAQMRAGTGASSMNALRDIVQGIQRAENLRLVALDRSEARQRLFNSIGIIVALAGLAFVAWSQVRTRQRRAATLALSNTQLERIVTERTRELENERLRIEALLRDVSHRVGNNLAMVSALLNVQSRKSADAGVKAALAQAQYRIQAIAAGQRRLRLDLDTDEIDGRAYMEDLLEEIGKAIGERPIVLDLAMKAIRLPGRDAVSFVVIVNELVTNAIKHAFPDDAPGRITVRFADDVEQAAPGLTLTVEDDGVGMTPSGEPKGLGQTVIASLLRSMRGTLMTEPREPGAARPGTRITVTFPRRA